MAEESYEFVSTMRARARERLGITIGEEMKGFKQEPRERRRQIFQSQKEACRDCFSQFHVCAGCENVFIYTPIFHFNHEATPPMEFFYANILFSTT